MTKKYDFLRRKKYKLCKIMLNRYESKAYKNGGTGFGHGFKDGLTAKEVRLVHHDLFLGNYTQISIVKTVAMAVQGNIILNFNLFW